MKRNAFFTQKLLTRVVMGLLLLAMLGGVLTSCAGGSAKYTSITKAYVIGENMLTDANGLTAAQLEKIAGDIAASKNGVTIRTQLVAAMRGFDMTAADFDDAKVKDGTLAARPEAAPTIALTVLEKNGIETFPYKNATTGEPIMTAADLELIVK